jgi:uncharacterized protein (DUF58 family)
MPALRWAELRWSRGVTILAIGLFALLAGVMQGSAGTVALGIAFLIAPTLVYLSLRASVDGVALSRVAPRSASEGDRVAVTIRIESRSRFPLLFARVTELFAPESLGSYKSVEIAGRLSKGRRAEQTYFAICRRSRGIYPHGPMLLEASDPFEWFSVRRKFDAVTEFKVFPRLRKTNLPDKVFSSISQPDSKDRVVRLLDSDEFFAVRDYLPGDPLKRVHWALTARRDFPVVREYLPSVQHAIVLFLDVSRQLRFSGARITNFESSVRFAASLASRVVLAGLPFELRCGSQGTFDVPAANGRGQLMRVLETLVRVRTRTDDSFAQALARRASSLPSGATIVVALHPYLLGDERVAGALVTLARRGFRVACLVYEVRDDAHSAESPARHRAYLRRLAAAGIDLWNEKGAPLLRRRALVGT